MISKLPEHPVWSDIDRILAAPKSKEFRDLRDRAAHMYLTRVIASHLRKPFTRALAVISSNRGETGSDGPAEGSLRIAADVIEKLDLDRHPMVVEVRMRQRAGWRIRPSLGPNRRKPYTKVFMLLDGKRMTVQVDGSILDHWPNERPAHPVGTPAPVRARSRAAAAASQQR